MFKKLSSSYVSTSERSIISIILIKKIKGKKRFVQKKETIRRKDFFKRKKKLDEKDLLKKKEKIRRKDLLKERKSWMKKIC